MSKSKIVQIVDEAQPDNVLVTADVGEMKGNINNYKPSDFDSLEELVNKIESKGAKVINPETYRF